MAACHTKYEASTVAEILHKRTFSVFGNAETIHSDNHRSFNNKLLDDVLKLLKIRHTTIPAFCANSNLVERIHAEISKMIRSVTLDSGELEWDKMLPTIAFAINTAINTTIKYSPFFLMFGRSARLEIEHLISLPITDDADADNNDDEDNKGDYAHRLVKRLQTALSYVKANHKKPLSTDQNNT